MAGNYWDRVLARRLGRRRAIAAAGSLAAGAAFLAACGGDDDNSSTGATGPSPTQATTGSTTSSSSASASGATGSTSATGSTGAGSTGASSGLITAPVNETAKAIRGGVFKTRNTFEPSTLDPHLFPNNFHVGATYSNLWMIKDGVLEYSSGEVAGDLVDSWEVSPDQLTITAKLHPDAHFAPIAPVDGRAVDAEDVVASWERHSTTSNQRGDFASSANPAAPIESITATDDRTIQIKLAAPNAVVTARLARATPGSMYIIPKEALDTAVLDLARTSIGSGPYYISEYTPSVSIKFKRNPGFGQDPNGFPFMDELEYPTVQEYATYLSQFIAGNIYDGAGISAEDILPTKGDIPELELMTTYFSTLLPRVGFGVEPGSLFTDERLRQAWVLTWDRDLLLSTVYNKDRFADEGLDVEIAYESGLQANTFSGWLLDPLGSDFGPNSKFFKPDLDEAKKLIVAAGFPDGVVEGFDLSYAAPGAGVPAPYTALIEPVIGLTQESGLFKWNLNIVQNYFAEFFPKYHNQSRAPFSGVAISLSNLAEDAANYVFSYYNSRGSLRMGTDDTLDELTAKAVQEFDEEARKELVHEIQRHEGGSNFYPRLGGGSGFSLAWPAVRNRQVYQGGSRTSTNNPSTLFLDPSKAPLA